MAVIDYESGPSGDFRASIGGTSGYPLGFGRGGGGGMGWLEALARRSAQNKLRKQELELKMAEYAYRNRRPKAVPVDPLDAERRKAQIAQFQAISGRAPLKTSWIGVTPALLPDANRMTGAQRKMFLPEQSTFQGPSLDEIDTRQETADTEWWEGSSPSWVQGLIQDRLSNISPNLLPLGPTFGDRRKRRPGDEEGRG